MKLHATVKVEVQLCKQDQECVHGPNRARLPLEETLGSEMREKIKMLNVHLAPRPQQSANVQTFKCKLSCRKKSLAYLD